MGIELEIMKVNSVINAAKSHVPDIERDSVPGGCSLLKLPFSETAQNAHP